MRTADSDPAYIAYFDEVELAAEFGHCFRDLGRSVQATERGAGSIFGDGLNNRSDFFATMVQAEAYLNQGDAGRGFDIALRALQLGEGLKSARCVQYVREFQGQGFGIVGWRPIYAQARPTSTRSRRFAQPPCHEKRRRPATVRNRRPPSAPALVSPIEFR